MKILIVGYAHGGTAYIAKLLQECGLDIRHEDYRGKDGIVSWPYAVDDDFLNNIKGWRQRGNILQYDVVLHQVREPLISIRSVLPEPNWTKIFRQRHLKDFYHKNPLVSGLRSWVGWHEICDKIADWTYKIEDLKNEENWFKFKKMCGLNLNLDYPLISSNINTKRNIGKFKGKWKNINNTWDSLRKLDVEYTNKAYDMAIKYGYKY